MELEYISLVSRNISKGYRYKIIWWDDAKGMRARIRKYMLSQIE
jgi:hypothetical protein